MDTLVQPIASTRTSSLLAGSNTLLLGPAGTGKTTSIGTLAEAAPELEVFFLPIESGIQSLFRYFADHGKPVPANLHWHEPLGIGRSFKDLAGTAADIGRMPEDTLYKMQDFTRSQSNQFEKILKVMCDFVDQNGKHWGPVDGWGPDKAIVYDGLSGLSNFARHMVAGKRPVMTLANWGTAQQQIENLLRLLTDGCNCHFILLAHLEREADQMTGGTKLMPRTLGKALPPLVSSMFNDVVLAVKEGDKFYWDTLNSTVDLKTSLLPLAGKLPPDFSAIIQRWKSLGGRFSSSVSKEQQS